MPKTLIIAEKPSVAKDIAAALGKIPKSGDFFEGEEYIVTSAVGHLVELANPEDYDKKLAFWSLKTLPIIPETFHLKVTERTADQFKLVKKLLARKDVEMVINACDAGREGELIFTYLYELAEAKKPFQRLWMQSMTPQSIRDAFKNLRAPEQMLPLQQAARSRSEADWLVGMNGTRAITKRLYGGKKEMASVGRVQTPTLMIVLERELAIRAFVPTAFWKLKATYEVKEGSYEGLFQKEGFTPSKAINEHDKIDRLWTEEEARALLDKVSKAGNWTVSETVKRGEQLPPRLFDLTTLQREANNRFGYSAASTLKIAQSLYERHKVLTYPRTDSQALPEDYIPVCKKTLANLDNEHASKVLTQDWVRPNKRIFNNAQVSDHFAIIPTGERADKLSEQEQKVYDMVMKRFIAVFYPAAQIDNTVRLTQAEGMIFKTEGKVLVDAGWMAVHGRASLESEPLVALTAADQGRAAFKSAALEAESTKPPARYTEATLLTAMESAGKLVDNEDMAEAMKERGLGTPATRASIIDRLISVGYMERDRRDLIPTAKAESLYDFLKAIKAETLTRPDLTGEWEYRLRLMEEKKLTRKEFMDGIVELTKSVVEAAKGFEEDKQEAIPTNILSPTDNLPILEKTRFFESQDGKIKVWKVMSGHKFELQELECLVLRKTVGPIEGFISKFGRKFSAKIKLEQNAETGMFEAKFDFGDQAARGPAVTVEGLIAGEQLGKCPVCEKGNVHEHANGYACEKAVGEKPACGFKLPKTLLGQVLSIDEAKKLVGKQETSPLPDFVSKRTGKKFTSILYLKKNGQLGWKFPPRAKKEKAEGEEKAPKAKRGSKKTVATVEAPVADKRERPQAEDVPF